jgi:hypothetical protein
MTRYAHRIGAVFYMLWGILHIIIGIILFYKLSTVGSHGAMAMTGSAVPPDQIPHVDSAVLNGMLAQYAWNVLWPGLFAFAIAFMNWKNSLFGYWYNLIVVTLVDSGFVCAILLPGHISLRDGLPGPVFWLLAVIFSTLGIRNNPRTTP